MRKSKWILSIGLVLPIAFIFYWVGFRHWWVEDRVYIIGWESDPPFQVLGPGGQPTGLAVELVREAARRRSIRLEWRQEAGSSEAALRSKKVDLWPLITITEERKKFFHITEPYLESEQCLLVHADSAYKEVRDLDRATISYFNLPMNYQQLHSYLPNARLVARSTLKASIEDVCRQDAAATFLEEYTAISALLGGLTCSNQPLRLIPIPRARPRLGIGAEEIDLLLTDIVMPGGINGFDLAVRLRTEKQELKVIYSSGYSDEQLGKDIPSYAGMGVLRKPYALGELRRIVRNTLDAGHSGS